MAIQQGISLQDHYLSAEDLLLLGLLCCCAASSSVLFDLPAAWAKGFTALECMMDEEATALPGAMLLAHVLSEVCCAA